ncbi:MAG: hypothetical protein CMJ76_14450 [Planctomycetaceae bacterium]|nr:hypothetical protein [Planctomycetaceae bacterium]
MTQNNVFKIGGSLISSAGYIERVRHHLYQFQGDTNIIICGGGTCVQRIRQYQQQFNLSEAECHHNSLIVMDRNTRQLCQQSGWPLINSWGALTSCINTNTGSGQSIGYAVTDFVMQSDCQLPAPHLPPNWSTTSDSIAARIATLLNARLYLFKSVPPPAKDLVKLSNRGYVDNHFPIAAANINSLIFVDLSH